MRGVIASIADWFPVDPRDRFEQVHKRRERRPRRLIAGDRLSSLDLYVYLKARFGHPNGFQMALRSPSSDNLIHWHYTVGAGSAVMEVWQTNLITEILVEGIPPPTDEDWTGLINAFRADFATYGPKMSEVRKSLEHWHLFINPYKRLRDVLEGCRDELVALDLKSVVVPETPTTAEELAEFATIVTQEQGRFEQAFRLGLTIRMLAPVLAEAFVNLVLFLAAKPDIKNDQRLYQDMIRREIDVRVKGLHIHCNGFAQAVDATDDRFKAFQTLMNRRNDFLHGNVDPTKLKFDSVYFDYRTVPIFPKRASFGELALSHRLIHVQPDDALSDLNVVFQFIALVFESIAEKGRNTFKMFVDCTSPGWKPDEGRVGVLFSEHIIHSVVGPGTTNKKTSKKPSKRTRRRGKQKR